MLCIAEPSLSGVPDIMMVIWYRVFIIVTNTFYIVTVVCFYTAINIGENRFNNSLSS